VSLSDLFRAIWPPLLASLAASALSLAAVSGFAMAPVLELLAGAFLMGGSFALILLLGMGQWSAYVRLFRELTGSAHAA
jgi:hypothetical protein